MVVFLAIAFPLIGLRWLLVLGHVIPDEKPTVFELLLICWLTQTLMPKTDTMLALLRLRWPQL